MHHYEAALFVAALKCLLHSIMQHGHLMCPRTCWSWQQLFEMAPPWRWNCHNCSCLCSCACLHQVCKALKPYHDKEQSLAGAMLPLFCQLLPEPFPSTASCTRGTGTGAPSDPPDDGQATYYLDLTRGISMPCGLLRVVFKVCVPGRSG